MEGAGEMLWMKGWLETRARVVLGIFMVSLFLVLNSVRPQQPRQPGIPLVVAMGIMVGAISLALCAWLAGAGITTQDGLRKTRGLEGSTQFTLSLPVSRLRLVGVRAALGWMEVVSLETLFCFAMWRLRPLYTGNASAVDMLRYVATVAVCVSIPYFISVLLGTFLDDQWRTFGTMIATGALGALPNLVAVPDWANLLRALGVGSPLVQHHMEWGLIVFSLLSVTALFAGAVTIARTREY
jgi:hypothetical protein